MDDSVVRDTPYPARSKTAVGAVNGIRTEAEVTYFADKILVLVSQEGRLAQWIQVPLSAPSSASVDAALAPGLTAGSSSLLPATHLTPRTLFGAGGEARETFGQLVAAQIASVLALRDAADQRTVMVGLGLDTAAGAAAGPATTRGTGGSSGGGGDASAQTTYFDVVDLVQKAL